MSRLTKGAPEKKETQCDRLFRKMQVLTCTAGLDVPAALQQKNRQPVYLLPKLSCFADWEHRPQEAPIARCVVTD